jgi:catechol 2,3-dioxygenase
VIFEARDVPGWGTTGDILFVSAGGYHHHLGFNTWKSKDGSPQPDGVTGLHHGALNFSSKARLAEAVRRLVDTGVSLRQLSDHGTHLAVYLSDPDGNDLELDWDRMDLSVSARARCHATGRGRRSGLRCSPDGSSRG